MRNYKTLGLGDLVMELVRGDVGSERGLLAWELLNKLAHFEGVAQP